MKINDLYCKIFLELESIPMEKDAHIQFHIFLENVFILISKVKESTLLNYSILSSIQD